jgi:hypothetical protein
MAEELILPTSPEEGEGEENNTITLEQISAALDKLSLEDLQSLNSKVDTVLADLNLKELWIALVDSFSNYLNATSDSEVKITVYIDDQEPYEITKNNYTEKLKKETLGVLVVSATTEGSYEFDSYPTEEAPVLGSGADDEALDFEDLLTGGSDAFEDDSEDPEDDAGEWEDDGEYGDEDYGNAAEE